MSTAALRAGCAAALAAAIASACSRGTPARIEALRVAEGGHADALREAGLDPAALDGAIREGLAGAGLRVDGGRGRAYRATATVRGISLGAGGAAPRIEVVLEVELAPAAPGGDVLRETGTGTVAVDSSRVADAFRRAASAAARQAGDALALSLSEARKGEGQLLADLASDDRRVRAQAVRALGERRSAAAVPALIERLRDDDADVVHSAIGALARIGDPRAVGPLIALSRRGDPSLTARMARVIGDIGGTEAEGYLLTLASGHPDPRVRRAARDALAEMDARATEASASARP